MYLADYARLPTVAWKLPYLKSNGRTSGTRKGRHEVPIPAPYKLFLESSRPFMLLAEILTASRA